MSFRINDYMMEIGKYLLIEKQYFGFMLTEHQLFNIDSHQLNERKLIREKCFFCGRGLFENEVFWVFLLTKYCLILE